MSTISVDYDVLNQKGSPAWFSDTFANIPTFGYKGRMFISIDTFAFYRDTGTGWDLIGGPGIGTLTGSGATGQVSFFNGTQVLTGNNNLFWDNTNSRLGINTATPGQALDVHSTANTLVQLNNTTTADSIIAFQNQNVTKWKIGNVYSAGANSFDITNPNLATTPFTISSAGAITLASNVTTTGAQLVQNGLYVSNANAGAQALYTTIYGRNDGINFGLRNSTGGAGFIFQSANSYDYTFPATAGTIALTSNLSSYLPLSGGTLTGALIGTSATFTGDLTIDTNTLFVDSTNNRIGIGTTSPTNKLTISNDGNAAIALRINDTNANASFLSLSASNTDAAIIANGTSAIPIDIYTGGSARVRVSSAGLVGIGTISPVYKFHVSNNTNGFLSRFTGGTSSDVNISMFGSTAGAFGSIGTESNHAFNIFTNGTDRITILSTGNVGMGTAATSDQRLTIRGVDSTSSNYVLALQNASPATIFFVRNDGYFNTGTAANSPYNLTATGRSMIVDSGGGVGYLVSTRESKANIESIKNIDFINQLNPVQFNYRKKDYDTNIFTDELYENITYGFIADEVEKVNKELAFYNADGSLAGVEYNSMIAILTKAIQELNEKLVRNNIN